VVALEDWIMEVTPSPVSTPLNGLEVIEPKRRLKPLPAAFWIPELIKLIPMRNIPRPPSNVTIIKNINYLFFRF
jgi:hypothetical protein